MGHSRGHHAQSGHFAGLNQLGFLFYTFGDIGGRGDQNVCSAISRITGTHIYKKGRHSFFIMPFFREKNGPVAGQFSQARGNFRVILISDFQK